MPRFILIERPDRFFGDSAYPVGEGYPAQDVPTPAEAARMIGGMMPDYGVHDYFETHRGDRRAVFDAYLAKSDWQNGTPPKSDSTWWIKKDCQYVATLARKEKICCICNAPLELEGWQYGHDARPVVEGQCCTPCEDYVVIPARVKAGTWYPDGPKKKAARKAKL